jgi:MFS family permease
MDGSSTCGALRSSLRRQVDPKDTSIKSNTQQSIIIQCFSKTWWEILIARTIAGLAGGLMGTSCMVYMSEIAMPQFRGALLAAFSMAFALGQVFLAVGLKVLEETEPLQFRRMFYSEFVFTGLWLVSLVVLPESPGKGPGTN